MKKLFLAGIATLFLATGTAHAEEWQLKPPKEFDHEYIGTITVIRVPEIYKGTSKNSSFPRPVRI
jgi:hypothetical protein